MKRLMIKLLVVAIFMFAATSAFADYSYNFDVNTSSLLGQTGYIELQFNPGLTSGAASAVVTNFTSDAALNGEPLVTGDATGALSSTVVLNNTSSWNDYFQSVTFGNTIHYSLTLSGAAGNSFGLSFYDANGVTPLLTTDPSGFATTIDLNANGAAVNNLSNQVTVAQTPIPAAGLLFGSGLLGMFGIRRRIMNI